jgi:glycosyltransferase involved in cell wall biosynthesis
MKKPKVLLVTIADLSALGDPMKVHGSTVVSKNTLDCLSQISAMDFLVASIVLSGDGSDNARFVRERGMEHVSVLPSKAAWPNTARGGQVLDVVREIGCVLMDKYFFMHERLIRQREYADELIRDVVREQGVDLIVFDHIYPTYCLPSLFHQGVPCCLISVNNEVPFHRTYKAMGGPAGEGLLPRLMRWISRRGNWISNRRFELYVSWLHRRLVGIVTLNPNDLPRTMTDAAVRAVIPPLLKKSDCQWSYQESRTIFFLGNIWLYSNREAIEWICTRFAPALHSIDASIQLRIIGARRDQAREGWAHSNIIFMGQSNAEEVSRLMGGADLFIAPISNPFGAKLKIAECVSYATPFLATYEAMSGLPFRDAMPKIHLTRPDSAARLAADYINDPTALKDLSRAVDECAHEARSTQVSAWRDFLRRCLERGAERCSMDGCAGNLP